MDDYGLVLNAGSSSLKFCVFVGHAKQEWQLAARGQIDGIGTSPKLSVKDDAGAKLAEEELDASVKDGKAALAVLADWLKARWGGSRVLGVGHRVVHGGAKYAGPSIVTREVIEDLRTLIPLAPLHQPYNIGAIEAVAERLPDVPQVACFDTSFHRGQRPVAELIPLPKDLRDSGVQRYGFHGLSYEYIASVLPEVAPEIADGRVIVAHLGSGASMCALRKRRSVGTRPGSVDPGVILHLFQTVGLSATEVEKILYKKSGLLGVSGISNDMRDLLDNPDPHARLAVDYFVYQAAKQVGALAAVLGGVDALVFTAGIGERSAEIRRRISEASAWLGVTLDPAANQKHGPRITTSGSKVSVWVIPTNEELMIARHTGALLGISARRQPAATAGV
jgi:acetate kinase